MEEFSTEATFPSNLAYFETLTGESYDFQNESSGNDSHGSFYIDMNIKNDVWTLWDSNNLQHGLAWSITLIISYLMVFIVGTIGNILVIMVIVSKPPMHPVTNMFLLNLAIADLLVIVFCVPVTLIANLFSPWILGSFMCKGAPYVQGVSVCASAYSLTALSLDRCKAICRPIERHQGQGITKFQAMSTIALLWTFSIIITLPWLLVFQLEEEDGHYYCHEIWEDEFIGNVYFAVAQLACCYIIPFLIILSSNTAIWYNVSNRPIPTNSVSNQRIIQDGVKKTLGAVTAAFLTSWLPLYVIVSILKFSPAEALGEWWKNALLFVLPGAQWLGSLNSCMNPILYAFLNGAFRKGFKSFLSSIRRQQN